MKATDTKFLHTAEVYSVWPEKNEYFPKILPTFNNSKVLI